MNCEPSRRQKKYFLLFAIAFSICYVLLLPDRDHLNDPIIGCAFPFPL
jgi:hypothetical protein